MKKKHLTDKEFFAMLRENAGIFSRTAKAIQRQFSITYSRQAVRDRALNNPEILSDIEEENIDIAEEGLHTLMRSKNEQIRFKAIDLFLKTKGKKRGYVERTEVETTNKTPELKIIVNNKETADNIRKLADADDEDI
jgi:phage antirepressor YoqD-like protein